jgi:peptidoglycan hydrolase CwlO-like protein
MMSQALDFCNVLRGDLIRFDIEEGNKKVNCIEADNEINLKPSRIDELEERINSLQKTISLLHEIMETKYDLLDKYVRFMFKYPKNSCDKCHPTFEEDGIL